MTTITRERSAVADALRAALDLDVTGPDDPGYDLARRLWNADVDRRPACIVRPRSAQDVSAIVTWCVARGQSLTTRSGGHNLAGTSVGDGAVVVDTCLLNEVTLRPDGSRVTVGGGCRWGDVDRATESSGVAVPAGVVSHTGVAGLTLGGGTGYLGRQFGATVDYVEEIEVVVADGRILTASRSSHPELFWALRGAGHNYGIATRFVFRTVRLAGPATVRQELYGADARLPILRQFRDWAPSAPRNVGTYVRLLNAPAYWSQIPAEHRGRPIISVATVFYGDPADEPAATAPMYGLGTALHSSVRTMPHVTLQHATDDEFRYGISHYWKHVYLTRLDEQTLQTILEQTDRYPGRSLNSSANIAHQLICPFEMIAGLPTPRDDSDDATVGVGGIYSSNIGADWEFPSERAELVAWAKQFEEALGDSRGGTYINFTSVAGDEEVARAVYGAKYDRLVAVKRAYDPDNVFSRGLVDLSEHLDETD